MAVVDIDWWQNYTPEQFTGRGIDPQVAEAVGAMAVHRVNNTEHDAELVAIEPLLFTGEPSPVVKRVAHPVYRSIVEQTFAGSNMAPVMMDVVRPSEGPEGYLIREARRASDMLAFNRRLEYGYQTPVLFMDHNVPGGVGDVFWMKLGRSTGEALRLTTGASKTGRRIEVPTDGYVYGGNPSFYTPSITVEKRPGLLSAYPCSDTEFMHDPKRVGGNTQGDSQLWLAGEDTIQRFAKRLAATGIRRSLGQPFTSVTDLEAVTNHPLFLLKAITTQVGLDIEQDPHVKQCIDKWRQVANKWAKGKIMRPKGRAKELHDDPAKYLRILEKVRTVLVP